MQETIVASQERKDIITEKASVLSKQMQVRCMNDLLDQAKALATSAQIVIPMKEVRVTLDISIVTGIGSRAGASSEMTIPINPNFSDVMEEDKTDGKRKRKQK